MELFFERNKVVIFSMKIDPSATVLEMKQKIEKSYGISVSNQTIFFKGKILNTDRDSHTLNQCKIVNKSRLEFYFCRSRHIREVRQRREQQSRAPSVKDVINIEDSPEKNQDSSNDDHQTEKSLVPPPSYTLEEIFGIQTEGNVRVQEPSWSNENLQDWFQSESSSTSNIFGDFSFGEDYPLLTDDFTTTQEQQRINDQDDVPLSFGDFSFVEDVRPLSEEYFANIQSFDYTSTTQEQRDEGSSQVVQTEKTPRIREVIDLPDSPESISKKRAKKLMRVMVLSFPIKDTPGRKFPVEVNPSDNVEVLRTELAKMQQRSQLLLPEEGYFFIHKTRMMNEKQSFRWNRVDQGDTIEIFPGIVTDDHRTNTRT